MSTTFSSHLKHCSHVVHLISSAVRVTLDHQLLVNAVMPREQPEGIQAKICCCGLLPAGPPSFLSDLMVENQRGGFHSDLIYPTCS